MRDLLVWGFALLFLVTAFHTVHVRRDVYRLGREIGALEETLFEQRRRADNLRLELERLASPAQLKAHAEKAGIAIIEREGTPR